MWILVIRSVFDWGDIIARFKVDDNEEKSYYQSWLLSLDSF